VTQETTRSVQKACKGPLSVEDAAALLRVREEVVERDARSGLLPTVQQDGVMYVDGPRLLALFRQPVQQGRPA
jgi:hypothetical protein